MVHSTCLSESEAKFCRERFDATGPFSFNLEDPKDLLKVQSLLRSLGQTLSKQDLEVVSYA